MKSAQEGASSHQSNNYNGYEDYLYVLSDESDVEEEVKPKIDLEQQALLHRKEKFIKEISEAIKDARARLREEEDSEDSCKRRQKRVQLKPKGSLSSYHRNNRAQYQYKAYLTNKNLKQLELIGENYRDGAQVLETLGTQNPSINEVSKAIRTLSELEQHKTDQHVRDM